MRAQDILDDLLARGAAVYRIGDRLAVDPSHVLDDTLRGAIRAEKERLLELVPEIPSQFPPQSRAPTPRAWLLDSPGVGPWWLAVDADAAAELRAEEADWERLGDRAIPVLASDQVEKLRGRAPCVIRATLGALAVFPDAKFLA